MTDVIDSMLDLMRRLPPTRTEENVQALVNICPDDADELLQSVDQPLQVMVDRMTGREYLACDYNRDGESYRYVLVLFVYHLPLANFGLAGMWRRWWSRCIGLK